MNSMTKRLLESQQPLSARPAGVIVRRTSLSLSFAILLMTASCFNRPIQKVNTRYWASPPGSLVKYPEQDPNGDVWADLRDNDNLGLCFSGGGTRSATATVGQLRALRDLQILPRVRYISSVSGGSWTATPYTFIKEERMDQFLEDYVKPEDIGEENLKAGEGSMTAAVTHSYLTARGFGRMLVLGGSESFARALSVRFLEPFDLGQPGDMFTWNEKTAAKILNRNKDLQALKKGRYHTVPKGRPFLVVGGTIQNYDVLPWKMKSLPEKRVPMEFTPLYSGTRVPQRPTPYNKQPLGGGYVESFAYDSIRPVKKTGGTADATLYHRVPFRSALMLGLGDVMGSSGAAPGLVEAGQVLLGLPVYNIWSPQELEAKGKATDEREAHMDGGQSDNQGLLALLARRVDKAIVFVNSSTKFTLEGGEWNIPGIDSYFRNGTTKVFDEGLDKIKEQVARSVSQRGPAVAESTLRVLDNPRFGINSGGGNYRVKIFWVFLDGKVEPYQGRPAGLASGSWIEQSPYLTNLAGKNDKAFKNFPNYSTFFQNKHLFRLWDVVRLNDKQATMLAHYAAWTVMESRDKLRNFVEN